MKDRLIIGIDPDLRKNGVAFIKNGKVKDLANLSMIDLVEMIVNTECFEDPLFVLEDVEAIKTTVFKQKRKGGISDLRTSENIGKVKAVKILIKEALDHYGCDYKEVKPLRGDVKKAKKDAKYFNLITGWNKSSNQDNRDAALLALFGINKSYDKLKYD